MKYIVIFKDKTSFVTDWFSRENCWTDDIFCVVDRFSNVIMFDGEHWEDIEEDHL